VIQKSMSLKHPITPEPRPQDDFWVLCGYAGWGPGQLQGEIEDRKSWHVAAASVKVLQTPMARGWPT